MTTVCVKLFKIIQQVKLEYGRFSALPHHAPTSTVEIEQESLSIYPVPQSTGSAFQDRDPATNMPPPEDARDLGERCYVIRGDYTVELTDFVVEVEKSKGLGKVVLA
jgi:hypothetical protein